MSKITGEKVRLAQLFGDEFYFSIPDYQRPYSWEEDHCEQLLDDLNNASKDKEYFLGTIILQETAEIGHGHKYDIIDGQQRITTLQLLFAVLRDYYEKPDYKKNTQELIYQAPNQMKNIPERVRLEVIDKHFFKNIVQTEGKTKDIETADTTDDSQLRMKLAIKAFRDKLSTYSQAKLEKLGEFLLQKCVVVYVSTESFADAYQLFIIVNDRGLQLRRIDILKAQNLDPNAIKDPSERKEYARKWERMEKDLTSETFEQLFYHIRSIEIKEKANEDLLKEFTSLVFDKKKIFKGKDFIDYVQIFKDIYQKILIDQDLYNSKPEFAEFSNLVYIMQDYLSSNEWIPSLLSFYKKFKENNLLLFLQKLESKFVGDWVTGMTLGKRISNTYTILKEIEQAKSPNDILSSKVFDYDKIKFTEAICQSDFYSEPYSKYILAKLDYLIGENTSERRIIASSIEHVLPQTPKKNSTWDSVFTDLDKAKWTNHIANLVLLSRRKNSSASNLDFNDKKDKYLKGKITDLPSSIGILKYSDWTPIVLNKREKDIVSLLVK